MPTYEYLCDTCQKTFDVFQSMSDKKLKKCPDENCEGAVKRLISGGAGVIFKGSGFYSTDYRSDSYKKGEASDKKAANPKKSSKTEKKSSCGSSCACT